MNETTKSREAFLIQTVREEPRMAARLCELMAVRIEMARTKLETAQDVREIAQQQGAIRELKTLMRGISMRRETDGSE